jgi:hypothetical protein
MSNKSKLTTTSKTPFSFDFDQPIMQSQQSHNDTTSIKTRGNIQNTQPNNNNDSFSSLSNPSGNNNYMSFTNRTNVKNNYTSNNSDINSNSNDNSPIKNSHYNIISKDQVDKNYTQMMENIRNKMNRVLPEKFDYMKNYNNSHFNEDNFVNTLKNMTKEGEIEQNNTSANNDITKDKLSRNNKTLTFKGGNAIEFSFGPTSQNEQTENNNSQANNTNTNNIISSTKNEPISNMNINNIEEIIGK